MSVSNEFSGGNDGNVFQTGDVGSITIYQGDTRRIPRQLPARLPNFVDRLDLLARAGTLLSADPAAPTRVAVLTGLAGSGKTRAAGELAGLRSTSFPGGELYVDLRVQTVRDALGACVRSYGVKDELIPDSLPELTNLYRSCAAGRACLVVLDDVTEPAQVYPFLPNGSGSVVLVTSNDRLAELIGRLGAEVMVVEPLNAEHGRDLLASICGAARLDAEPAETAELVALCEGLPIALRTAATRLVERRSLRVGKLVADVKARGIETVSGLFSVVYQDLSEANAQLYRRLSMLPVVEFGERLAEEATGTRGSLDRLAAVNLLAEPDNGRFRFHSLVLRHAQEQALAGESASAREGVVLRAIQYYAQRAALADQHLLGPGRLRFTPAPEPLDDPWDGLDPYRWLDAERTNLLATVRAAYEYGWYDEAWQLAESLTALYLGKRYKADWIESSEVGALAANQVGNRRVEARLRSFSSRALLDLGQVDRARRQLDESLPLAQESGDVRLLASVWEQIGRFRDAVGDPAGAIAAYEQSVAEFAKDDDRRGIAFVTVFLGRALLAQGRLVEAESTLRQAIELCQEHDTRMTARARTGLGIVHMRQNRLDDAHAELTAALNVLVDGGHLNYVAHTREALADLASRRGDEAERRAQLTAALEIQRQFGGPEEDRLRAKLGEANPVSGND
ncbi:tetratricopeptide repeat protein [Kutzneria sp. NPDC052558]|uniref:tetratricopeptide repeat protein n=1 Tax=Kutzneria sp. NPDC052558 TaxID=3364121 RepID=UPI0037C77C4B